MGLTCGCCGRTLTASGMRKLFLTWSLPEGCLGDQHHQNTRGLEAAETVRSANVPRPSSSILQLAVAFEDSSLHHSILTHLIKMCFASISIFLDNTRNVELYFR
uniref:Uncharacterized protein n=1 Tax=Rhodnius prolixus TaxID=13249 RepID=T1HUX9_RHOPR